MKTSLNKNEGIRLQKVIADSGLCSRRKAELLIANGSVKVNGEIVQELGFKAVQTDMIEVDGIPLTKEKVEYYLLNKPKGYLSSASDDRGRQTVADLISGETRLYPVGRLDKETTGALILTNDGAFTQAMTHPKFHVSKQYHVSVEGILTDRTIQTIFKGFKLDGQQLQPAEIKNIKRDKTKNRTQFDIVLHEGKNRQIRRMMEFFGHDVLKLHRTSIEFLEVSDLKIGQYRPLKPFEIKKLKALAYGNTL